MTRQDVLVAPGAPAPPPDPALAGWTMLELIDPWVVRLFRRDPA